MLAGTEANQNIDAFLCQTGAKMTKQPDRQKNYDNLQRVKSDNLNPKEKLMMDLVKEGDIEQLRQLLQVFSCSGDKFPELNKNAQNTSSRFCPNFLFPHSTGDSDGNLVVGLIVDLFCFHKATSTHPHFHSAVALPAAVKKA